MICRLQEKPIALADACCGRGTTGMEASRQGDASGRCEQGAHGSNAIIKLCFSSCRALREGHSCERYLDRDDGQHHCWCWWWCSQFVCPPCRKQGVFQMTPPPARGATCGVSKRLSFLVTQHTAKRREPELNIARTREPEHCCTEREMSN